MYDGQKGLPATSTRDYRSLINRDVSPLRNRLASTKDYQRASGLTTVDLFIGSLTASPDGQIPDLAGEHEVTLVNLDPRDLPLERQLVDRVREARLSEQAPCQPVRHRLSKRL